MGCVDIITWWKRCGFVYPWLLLEGFFDATSLYSVPTVIFPSSTDQPTPEFTAKVRRDSTQQFCRRRLFQQRRGRLLGHNCPFTPRNYKTKLANSLNARVEYLAFFMLCHKSLAVR